MKEVLLPASLCATLRERGRVLAPMHRIQVVHARLPIWPSEIEERSRLGFFAGDLPGFAIFAADAETPRRLRQDAMRDPVNWGGGRFESIPETILKFVTTSRVDCLALMGAEQIRNLSEWFAAIHLAAVKRVPLCLFLFTTIAAKSFTGQKLRLVRHMVADPLEFSELDPKQVESLLDESEIPAWIQIRDSKLRQTVCRSIHRTCEGDVARFFDVVRNARRDESLLFDENHRMEFVGVLSC
jgi:hypothetical protein